MKSNILIIIAVTLAAVGVITLVIILSRPSDVGGPPDSHYSSGESSDDTSEWSRPSVHSGSSVRPQTGQDSEVAKNIVSLAYSLINTPFLPNGADPNGFDNSGFIYYVMRENGFLTCPRLTVSQSEWGFKIGYDSLREGDLVFFSDDGQSEISFGGIYVGGGTMVACITHDGVSKVWSVRIDTDYYMRNFMWGIAIS